MKVSELKYLSAEPPLLFVLRNLMYLSPCLKNAPELISEYFPPDAPLSESDAAPTQLLLCRGTGCLASSGPGTKATGFSCWDGGVCGGAGSGGRQGRCLLAGCILHPPVGMVLRARFLRGAGSGSCVWEHSLWLESRGDGSREPQGRKRGTGGGHRAVGTVLGWGCWAAWEPGKDVLFGGPGPPHPAEAVEEMGR